MTTYTCPYCDRQFALASSQISHVKVCLFGPMGEAVKALILSMSDDGCAPAYEEYMDAKTPGMPTLHMFKAQYGNWMRYIETLGLRPRLVRGGKNKSAWVKIVTIVDAMRDEHEQFIAAIANDTHSVYGQALHGWRERTYNRNGRSRTEYYTVLR